MENIMVPDETMNNHAASIPEAGMLPQLALMPVLNDYSSDAGKDEGLTSEQMSVLLFDDEDGDEEDMEEEENFDDMDEDFDSDFDGDEDDFGDEDEDYEDEEEDYDYEEDVDYDDFDE
jgi:hypothetical protein